MFELTVRGHFSSAHFLRDYDGQCKNLHGHTWKIAVTIQSNQLNDIGVATDFVELKKQLNVILSRLDHTCLNDIDFFQTHNPTAENLAKYIYAEYKKLIAPVVLLKARVWESDQSDVVYYE